MKTVTIRDVRHRWPETERAVAREGEILITRDGKPVAKLVRVDTPPDARARFDPEQHAEWQRRVGGRRATRWVDAARAERRSDRLTHRGRRRG
jgi:antitoxin (DNA-binding transcriptional repressor) of toxin-antitoxin stability system